MRGGVSIASRTMNGFACLGGEKWTVCCREVELFALIGAMVFVGKSTGRHELCAHGASYVGVGCFELV